MEVRCAKALDVLIDKYEAEEIPSIYNTSKVICPSFHKKKRGIVDKIDNYIDNLKACQIDSGVSNIALRILVK